MGAEFPRPNGNVSLRRDFRTEHFCSTWYSAAALPKQVVAADQRAPAMTSLTGSPFSGAIRKLVAV